MLATLLAELSLGFALLAEPSPYRVRLETTKGIIVLEIDVARAPRGADRFHELVTSGYYDDTRFFRVVAGKWAQFGINGNPEVSKRWRKAPIEDEGRAAVSPRNSNARGTVAFAFAEPAGATPRCSSACATMRDSTRRASFPSAASSKAWRWPTRSTAATARGRAAAFAAASSSRCNDRGNAGLDARFPRLDKLIRARVIGR